MTLKKTLFFIAVFFVCTNLFASIVITNGLTHNYRLKEGTLQKGIITIENTSNAPQNVRLYQQDYSYNATGTSFYEDYGKNKRSNLKWIKLNTDLLKIEGKGKASVSYEIIIPENTPGGSFWSVVMVEPVDDIVPNNIKNGIQLRTLIRYSIQIITTNEKPASALMTFDVIDLKKITGKNILELSISNNGEVFHFVEASIEIFDSKDGSNKGKFKSDIMSLLPNNSKLFTIDLSSVPAGKYNASILASSSDDHVFGINIELNIPNE
ncbi:MAG: hypothetical protein RRY99_07575 [Flavobacterium sp.]